MATQKELEDSLNTLNEVVDSHTQKTNSYIKEQNNNGGFMKNDTAQLQELFNKGGQIKLKHRHIYYVQPEVEGQPALTISSNTDLDMNEACIVLNPGSNCTLLKIQDGTENLSIKNGRFSSMGRTQPPFYTRQGICATILCESGRDMSFVNLEFVEAYQGAMYIRGAENVYANNIWVRSSIGAGISFSGSNYNIGLIEASDCNYFDRRNFRGNPVLLTLRDSTINSIYTRNSPQGIKIQNGSNNLKINFIKCFGGSNNIRNGKLLKLQGTPENPCHNINIGRIFTQNGYGNGLYIFSTHDLNIDTYVGVNNGEGIFEEGLEFAADTYMHNCDNVTFNHAYIRGHKWHSIYCHNNMINKNIVYKKLNMQSHNNFLVEDQWIRDRNNTITVEEFI